MFNSQLESTRRNKKIDSDISTHFECHVTRGILSIKLLDCFNTNCFFPKRPEYILCYLKRFVLPSYKLIFSVTYVTMITLSDCTPVPSLIFVSSVAPRFGLTIRVMTKVVISKHSPAMLVWVLLGPILASLTTPGMGDRSPIVNTVRSITVNIFYTRNLKIEIYLAVK